MRDGKSSCGFYYRRGLGNRAQSREPLRGYEPPGNRPPCAGWIPSSLSPSILPFHDVREWISCGPGGPGHRKPGATFLRRPRRSRHYTISQEDEKVATWLPGRVAKGPRTDSQPATRG